MKETMEKYAGRLAAGSVEPLRSCGRLSGLVFDPACDDVPLEVLAFGLFQLGREFLSWETKEREMVIVPQEGSFEARIDGRIFSGGRTAGPFAAGPGRTNAAALYVPRASRLLIRGEGEVAFFTAPALGDRPACLKQAGEISPLTRGEWVWRRTVVPLVSPKDASTNLVVGETYSPPGFWSGTPPHRHDCHDPGGGESDHEEVYYHRFNCRGKGPEGFGAFGVQLLMDGKELSRAYVIGDRSAFAIPGGCHPVVASPAAELLYLWGLAGKGGELAMRDVEDLAYLKTFEEVLGRLAKEGPPRDLTEADIAGLAGLGAEERAALVAILREKGYRVGP